MEKKAEKTEMSEGYDSCGTIVIMARYYDNPAKARHGGNGDAGPVIVPPILKHSS